MRLIFHRRFSGCFRSRTRSRSRPRRARRRGHAARRARGCRDGATLARPRLTAGVAPGGTGDHRRQNPHQPESGVSASEARGDRAIPKFLARIRAQRIRAADIGHLVDQRQDAVAVAAGVLQALERHHDGAIAGWPGQTELARRGLVHRVAGEISRSRQRQIEFPGAQGAQRRPAALSPREFLG